MYSLKPGRGPSLMGGVGGIIFSVLAAGMAIFAGQHGAPSFFLFFIGGIGLFGLIGALYNFYNMGAKNRMSAIDITTVDEESDPIADALGYGSRDSHATTPPSASSSGEADPAAPERHTPGDFCPFCGKSVQQTFAFCPHCGKGI